MNRNYISRIEIRYTGVSEKSYRYKCSDDIAKSNIVKKELNGLDREKFMLFLLDGKNRVLNYEIVSLGSLNSSIVHPRESFKSAVKNSAASVVFIHNHPTGDPTPSSDDIAITKRLVEAGKILGIKVLDHIIVGDTTHFSFSEENLL
ncbi:MAG: DNA repair protein RadC [Actinobacteria bacterium]|nr:DNA repair protein RadC [Actinomycetota bacterium]